MIVCYQLLSLQSLGLMRENVRNISSVEYISKYNQTWIHDARSIKQFEDFVNDECELRRLKTIGRHEVWFHSVEPYNYANISQIYDGCHVLI